MYESVAIIVVFCFIYFTIKGKVIQLMQEFPDADESEQLRYERYLKDRNMRN